MRFDIRPVAIPAVSGLVLTAGVKSYQLTWEHLPYSVEVWAATTNNRASATLLATVSNNTYTHITNGVQYFYWVITLDALDIQTGVWNPASSTGGLTQQPSSTGRLMIASSSAQWSVGPTGLAINENIILTANLIGGLSGFVTWTKTGAGTIPPNAGSTNNWMIYAADQSADENTYTATLSYGGVVYSDSISINRVRDGAQGDTGDTGQTGSMVGYGTAYGISSTVWSDSIANRVISNMLLGESITSTLAASTHLLPGDTVTLSNGTTFAKTRFWDGGSWVDLGTVIDGNLLVHGSVTADKITAGAISTGYNANARINIGNTTFIGTIKSPLHVSKLVAEPGQTLISAQNTKDTSVAIWGSSIYTGGNAVSGTWHASQADADAGKWSLLGVLGSEIFGAAVVGHVHANTTKFGGNFRYFSTESTSGSPVVQSQVQLAGVVGASPRAIIATGKVQLFGPGSSLILNTSEGTPGQVLTSAGSGATPTWTTPSGGGGTALTYGDLQTVTSGTTGSALKLKATFQVTDITVPSSGLGVELAFDTNGAAGYANTSYLMSYNRETTTPLPLRVLASTFTIANATAIDFSVAPTCPTPATAENSTKLATTGYVKAQGYTTNAGTVTSFSFTTGNGITGSVSNASTTPALALSLGAVTGTSFNGITGLLAAGVGNNGSATTAARSDHVHAASTFTYAGLQSVTSGATGSALGLTTTFQVTGLNVPTSGNGVELIYDSNGAAGYATTSYLMSVSRPAATLLPLRIHGSTVTFNVNPVCPTPATSDNNTNIATTAYVKAQGYTGNTGTVTSFSFTTGNGISGSVSNPTTTPALSLTLGALTGTSFNSITGLSSTTPSAPGTTAIGNATTAARADHVHALQTTLNGYKCFGGSGITDASGNLTITFPSAFTSSTSFGFSAISTTNIYVVVTSAAAGSVTIQAQSRSAGTGVAGAAIRWTAVGT